MSTVDRTAAPDAVFAARIAAIEAAPDAPESWAATVGRAARAIHLKDCGCVEWESVSARQETYYRRLATVALRAAVVPPDGVE